MITRKCVDEYMEQVNEGEPTPHKIRDYALLCIAQDHLKEEHHKHRHGHMDEYSAKEWTCHMQNSDGTTGPHWPMDDIKKLMEQHKELQEFDLPDVYAVINMMHSDYSEVAKKLNVNNIDFYVWMTKAWLDDKDVETGKGKTAAYYEYVVK